MFRSAFLRSLPTFALGVVVLLAAVGVAVATPTLRGCYGGMQTTNPAALCFDHGKARAEADTARSREPLAILAAQAGRTCTPATAWPSGKAATWAVMRDAHTGAIVGIPFDRAWQQATTGAAWTVSLCA